MTLQTDNIEPLHTITEADIHDINENEITEEDVDDLFKLFESVEIIDDNLETGIKNLDPQADVGRKAAETALKNLVSLAEANDGSLERALNDLISQGKTDNKDLNTLVDYYVSSPAIAVKLFSGTQFEGLIVVKNTPSLIFAGSGNDMLIGGESGNDHLGDDCLLGGLERDILFGDEGNDILTSGNDKELFIIPETFNSHNIISDSSVGEDVLLLTNAGNISPDQLSMTQDGFNTHTGLGNNQTPILNHVNSSDLIMSNSSVVWNDEMAPNATGSIVEETKQTCDAYKQPLYPEFHLQEVNALFGGYVPELYCFLP